MAHLPTHQSTQVLPAQAGISRRSVYSVWMGPTGAPKPLLVWCSIQHHTCLQLPQRSISKNQAQLLSWLDSPTSHRSVPKCWGWTTPSTPIWRNFLASNHKHGRQCKIGCESPWILGKREARCILWGCLTHLHHPMLTRPSNLSTGRMRKREGIWEADHRNWAWLFHTPSDVSNWWTGPLSWNLLQEIGLHDQPKALLAVLQDNEDDSVHVCLFTDRFGCPLFETSQISPPQACQTRSQRHPYWHDRQWGPPLNSFYALIMTNAYVNTLHYVTLCVTHYLAVISHSQCCVVFVYFPMLSRCILPKKITLHYITLD